MDYKDYYKILGVDRSADEKEIKRAYRRLARKHHPDVNPGDTAAETQFKEINEAYEVLGDSEKRKKYDQFGSQWREYERAGVNPEDLFRQYGAQGGPGGARVRYARPEDLQDMFGGAGGFSDFFETLFGGGMRGQGGFGQGFGGAPNRRAATPTAGEDVEHPVEISLEEAFNGTTRILQMGDRRIEVKIPAGVRTGSRVRVAGEGGPGYNGGPNGDLYLVVDVAPNPMFEREGDDLTVDVPVDLYTAVLGGEATVPTIKGTRLSLRIPAGTQPLQRIRLRGQGMPLLKNAEQRGDLYARVKVDLPRQIDDRQRELFEELRALQDGGRDR